MNKSVVTIILQWISVMCLVAQTGVNPVEQARLHPIVLDKPAINFFEGAVLGNGGMGVVVTTRPDAIQFHFGHNNVWDIRLAEDYKDETGTFEDIVNRVKALPPDQKLIFDDEWLHDYFHKMGANYAKPYPRPFPCGTVVLGFDRGQVELLGHKLDIADGLCEIYLLNRGVPHTLQVFADMTADNILFRLVDAQQRPAPSCFNRLRVIPDTQTPKEFPRYTVTEDASLGFTQVLPSQEPGKYDLAQGHPKDRAFRLEVRLSSRLENGLRHPASGVDEPLRPMERYILAGDTPFTGCISLTEGLVSDVRRNGVNVPEPTPEQYRDARLAAEAVWTEYWNKSGVKLADTFLEQIWYWNFYFLNCAAKAGATCPGLFANWSLGSIGTAWHGDYHMNYNTQQPFWLPFSGNRLDKNLPYADLVDHLLPISEKWAKEYYRMRGAFFPHSAYPVEMTHHPYPVPDWGWEVFETPWTVQGLWWHYLYSMDTDFLRDRAFYPMQQATLFLIDYMKRPDAHGPQWNDDRYHIIPSVPPELYSLKPGFRYNYDTQTDITLTRFLFKAYLEAVRTLKYDRQEAATVKDVKLILSKLPDYSTAESPVYGEIYTSVPGETDRMVYNLPANLMHVFPGEEYGLDAPEDVRQKLLNTYRAHRNEGGNDLVTLSMIGVRLGVLDMEKFKRQVNYCLLPNGTAADLAMQGGGRYDDGLGFDFMAPMGIWFENFALPLVVNESLMQSYDGIIRLYPNWNRKQDAEFSTLRAVGAFLVSSKLTDGNVAFVRLLSEKGQPCRLKNPWGAAPVQLIRNGRPAEKLTGELLTFKTGAGETIELEMAQIPAASHATEQMAKPGLKFRDNGKFRILQLTDLHYNYEQPERAASTLAFIREAVDNVKPDLIIVTGDLVVSADTRRAWQDIADVLSESKTPWAVVFGNHDPEHELTNRQIIDLLSEYPYNLTENGPEDIFGNGNYVLTVSPSSPGKQTAAATLYCFDTKHEWLHYDQMDWYRRHSRRFAGENGGKPLPSLAFYHIPVPEFNEVIGKPTTVGVKQEDVCCPDLNSGSFTAMYECGDVMGIFVGHDHDNNYIGCLHNICLAYGYKSGRQSYGDIGRGVRVIELHEGERKFTTWLLQFYECDTKEGTWTPVGNVTPQYKVTYPDSFK